MLCQVDPTGKVHQRPEELKREAGVPGWRDRTKPEVALLPLPLRSGLTRSAVFACAVTPNPRPVAGEDAKSPDWPRPRAGAHTPRDLSRDRRALLSSFLLALSAASPAPPPTRGTRAPGFLPPGSASFHRQWLFRKLSTPTCPSGDLQRTREHGEYICPPSCCPRAATLGTACVCWPSCNAQATFPANVRPHWAPHLRSCSYTCPVVSSSHRCTGMTSSSLFPGWSPPRRCLSAALPPP